MNNKDNPEQCEAEICCKASANLQTEIDAELAAPDKSLAGLLNLGVAASGAAKAAGKLGQVLSTPPDIAEDDDDEDTDS